MKKKVLQIIQDLDVAGAQTVVMNSLRWLENDLEIEMYLAILRSPKETPYEKECKRKGYKVIYCNYRPFTKIPVVRSFVNWVRLQTKIYRVIKKVNPEVLHTHQTSIIPFVALPFAFSGVRAKYYTLHSDPYAVAKGHAIWARFALHCCGIKAICVTESQCEKAKKRYDIKDATVIHNGLPIEKYKATVSCDDLLNELCIPENSFVIGTVGRLSKIKNYDFLISIFAKYHECCKNSRLLFVGDGEEREHLVNVAKKLQIQDSIIFAGQRQDIERFYKVMDLFMLTSFYESSSIVTVEAQISGVRCVVADSIPDSVVVSGLVNRVPLAEPVEKWIDAIDGKLEPDNQVNTVESFSIEGVTKQLRNLYMV